MDNMWVDGKKEREKEKKKERTPRVGQNPGKETKEGRWRRSGTERCPRSMGGYRPSPNLSNKN